MRESHRRNHGDFRVNDEIEIFDRRLWLGGFFEAAGMVSLQRKVTKKITGTGYHEYPNIYPVLSYTDDSQDRIQSLQRHLGGEARPRGGKSWVWIAQYGNAFPIAEAMFSSAPSRRENLLAIKNVENASSLEEKEEIFQESRKNQRINVRREDYVKLLRHPNLQRE